MFCEWLKTAIIRRSRVAEVRKRIPGSGPILLLAMLFVAATFLAWYFSWFGRELSDADISKYLADDKEAATRAARAAASSATYRTRRRQCKKLVSAVNRAQRHPETEFRLTTAWLMGFDNRSQEFHAALLKLLHDQEPIVRRNAALALVRFEDHSGREELAVGAAAIRRESAV